MADARTAAGALTAVKMTTDASSAALAVSVLRRSTQKRGRAASRAFITRISLSGFGKRYAQTCAAMPSEREAGGGKTMRSLEFEEKGCAILISSLYIDKKYRKAGVIDIVPLVQTRNFCYFECLL